MTALRRVLGAVIVLASVFAAPRAATRTVNTILGTGLRGYSDTQVNNPYGIILGPDGAMYFCDLATGVITTVLGTGVKGDGPETSPLQCKLSRPHGLLAGASGTLFATDSEAHRIRALK